MNKKQRRELKRKLSRETGAPTQVVDEAALPFPRPVWFAGLFVLAFSCCLILLTASKVTLIHYDSYVYLFTARSMLGWKGAWLNAYTHPAVSWIYSTCCCSRSRFIVISGN